MGFVFRLLCSFGNKRKEKPSTRRRFSQLLLPPSYGQSFYPQKPCIRFYINPLARSGRKEVKDEKEKTIQKRRQDFYSGNGD
jgi:hypothetical protein